MRIQIKKFYLPCLACSERINTGISKTGVIYFLIPDSLLKAIMWAWVMEQADTVSFPQLRSSRNGKGWGGG